MEFYLIKVLFVSQAITTTRESPKSDAENKDLCDLALRGLHLLSAWTQQVMELVRIAKAPEKMLFLNDKNMDSPYVFASIF